MPISKNPEIPLIGSANGEICMPQQLKDSSIQYDTAGHSESN